MNILPIQSISFNSTKNAIKYYIPGKNDTTLRCFIDGKIEKPTHFKYEVLKRGNVIESKEFQNKKGFSVERFTAIVNMMQSKTREGFDFLYETLNAHIKGGN